MVAKSGLTTLSNGSTVKVLVFIMTMQPPTHHRWSIKDREFGSEIIIHPSYSPDIAPLEYHLFQSLQNFLNGVKLAAKEACENHLIKFLIQKNIEILQ
ncbi:hypothetical protein HZH68_002984 [Vespula germanica]|uniref:Histone-lysine N-methyltransferase SETMAR n=1 Tax=Vespula germanica TaxID=30212 RepID=A0A834U1Y0_VESGE|nr:hypothetical protein HZH68_002984 [Vespula germanica]